MTVGVGVSVGVCVGVFEGGNPGVGVTVGVGVGVSVSVIVGVGVGVSVMVGVFVDVGVGVGVDGQNNCPVEAIGISVPPGSVNTEPVTTQTFPGEVTLSLIKNVPKGYSSEYSIELSAQFVI